MLLPRTTGHRRAVPPVLTTRARCRRRTRNGIRGGPSARAAPPADLRLANLRTKIQDIDIGRICPKPRRTLATPPTSRLLGRGPAILCHSGRGSADAGSGSTRSAPVRLTSVRPGPPIGRSPGPGCASYASCCYLDSHTTCCSSAMLLGLVVIATRLARRVAVPVVPQSLLYPPVTADTGPANPFIRHECRVHVVPAA
jgi:hypothetical protein